LEVFKLSFYHELGLQFDRYYFIANMLLTKGCYGGGMVFRDQEGVPNCATEHRNWACSNWA